MSLSTLRKLFSGLCSLGFLDDDLLISSELMGFAVPQHHHSF